MCFLIGFKFNFSIPDKKFYTIYKIIQPFHIDSWYHYYSVLSSHMFLDFYYILFNCLYVILLLFIYVLCYILFNICLYTFPHITLYFLGFFVVEFCISTYILK